MPFVTVREIYEKSRHGNYAVGGFDAEHLYMIKAIVEAAEETRSPTIIFLWEKDIEAAGLGHLENMVLSEAKRASVPISLMLDHGTSVEFCLKCIQNGHSGVMIDASHQPLDENIAITKRVVECAKEAGVFVEGEIDIGGKCTLTGVGAIVAIGDIHFAPQVTSDPDDFIFILSSEGTIFMNPQGDFYGSLAGDIEVQLQPGCSVIWRSPEGDEVGFPDGSIDEPVTIDWIIVEP